MNLNELGWNSFFQRQFEQVHQADIVPARVIREGQHIYAVRGVEGDWLAEVAGEYRFHAAGRSAFPVAGDWIGVVARPAEGRATIRLLFDRQTTLSRKAVGTITEEQVIAANVDVIFLVCGLDGGRNFNLRRLERSLALTWESGAVPVVILNKVDLCDDASAYIEQVHAVAPGVPVFALSAVCRKGLDELKVFLAPGKTGLLIGPSGVGKTSLINALCGDESRRVGGIRSSDHRGRHTTTYRELVFLPGSGMMVDTPGMREIQLWGEGEGLDTTFTDIADMAAQCRFNGCRHEGEPGCAVQDALARGLIDPERYASYLHLKREMAYLARRKDRHLQQVEQRKWKQINRNMRKLQQFEEQNE